MRTIVTGTVGLDKASYLEKVVNVAHRAGEELTVCNVGQRMYAEAPDVAPGRILDLPISRLSSLRRSVFKDILNIADQTENIIVNTHATFRWRHGLFPAFDFDQVAKFDADLYICLTDNVDVLHTRLEMEHQIDHSLKDLLVWREEETLATELMMLGSSGSHAGDLVSARDPSEQFRPGRRPARFHILALGHDNSTARAFFRLMFRPSFKKTYLSFPITHVQRLPTVVAEITEFRRCIAEHFIVFDPSDLEEEQLCQNALAASERGQKVMEVNVLGKQMRFDVAEIMQVAGDIHAQIYARDFMLIDQADMIISYIPKLPNGTPAVSSGVERELQHAHEAAKEVYVIWRPEATPSPFITETATEVFANLDEALKHFQTGGYFQHPGPAADHKETLFPVW